MKASKSQTIVNLALLPCAALATYLLSSTPATGQSPPFTQAPPIGADTGAAILLIIQPDGTLRIMTDPLQGPFDGVEDTLIAVLNNSGRTINAIRLQSPNPIFSFDGDGICGNDSSTGMPYPNAPAGCPFGPTGYEGPGVSFTGISPDATSGTVVFTGGLAAGNSAYFALELAIETICPPISGVVPLYQCQRPAVYAHLPDPTVQLYCGNGVFCATGTANCDSAHHCYPGTISFWGCYLTACTMQVNQAASAAGIPWVAISPEVLNAYLQGQRDGYNGTLVNPVAVERYALGNNIPLYWTGSTKRDDFTLNNYLCNGLPVILAVKGNNHFVLATGQDTVNGTYILNDPDHCGCTHGLATCTGTLADYGNSYDGMRLFTTIPRPLTDVKIVAHSPVELILTDQLGRQTGFNPATGSRLGDIPESSYVAEALVVDDNDDTITLPQIKILEVLEPPEGSYSLQVLGTGSGPFTIDFFGYDSIGNPSISTVSGNASTGSSASYRVNYSSLPGSQIKVTALNKCPLTQGFWKNHPGAWPLASLTLGSQTYSKAELLTILQSSTMTDASVVIARQLAAAKLNIANGSNPAPIAATVTNADGLLAAFAGKLPYGVKPSSTSGQAIVSNATALDGYNSGNLTVGCQP